jgi:hypothetical protein
VHEQEEVVLTLPIVTLTRSNGKKTYLLKPKAIDSARIGGAIVSVKAVFHKINLVKCSVPFLREDEDTDVGRVFIR